MQQARESYRELKRGQETQRATEKDNIIKQYITEIETKIAATGDSVVELKVEIDVTTVYKYWELIYDIKEVLCEKYPDLVCLISNSEYNDYQSYVPRKGAVVGIFHSQSLIINVTDTKITYENLNDGQTYEKNRNRQRRGSPQYQQIMCPFHLSWGDDAAEERQAQRDAYVEKKKSGCQIM